MAKPKTYDFVRYLTSKRSVDDRALNRHVWASLARAIAALESDMSGPLRILEVGAGVGTMIERGIGWGLFSEADYTALDSMARAVAEAARRLPIWADQMGFEVERDEADGLLFRRGSARVHIHLKTENLHDYVEREENQGGCDLLIASALLDLLDLDTALPRLLACVRPGGLAYFAINFDGLTTFQPEIDPELDAQIEALYHRTMDERMIGDSPSGDSRTGRKLFHHLKGAGVEVLDAGASDWVVLPQEGRYPSDEAYFLHFIIHTIQEALKENPELDPSQLANWISARHDQIESFDLIYIAHQIDFLGKLPN